MLRTEQGTIRFLFFISSTVGNPFVAALIAHRFVAHHELATSIEPTRRRRRPCLFTTALVERVKNFIACI